MCAYTTHQKLNQKLWQKVVSLGYVQYGQIRVKTIDPNRTLIEHCLMTVLGP